MSANAKPSQQHKQQSTALRPHSQGSGGQVHNVLIGFTPARWVLSHLDSQLNGKWPEQ